MITRAVTVSVYPLERDRRKEIYGAIHRAFDLCQQAGNAAMRAYFTGDAAETEPGKNGRPRLGKLPAEVARTAYRSACDAAPELPTTSISDLCQRVRARYMQDRYACRVSGRQSVATFRSPLPYAVRTANWSLGVIDDDGRPGYAATLPIGTMRGSERPTLGVSVRSPRDAELLAKIARGEYERRTIELLPPGWKRKGPVRAKIVYRRPPAESGGPEGTLIVRTGSPSLLIAENGGRPFVWNSRALRGKILGYQRDLHARAQDRKMERRVPASRRRAQNDEGGNRAEKHANRVRTEIQHIAAQLAGYARRQGYAGVALDMTDRSWVDPFPWHKLETMTKQACENVGLTFSRLDKEQEDSGE